MTLAIDTKVELNNGVAMPLFGLGTWNATGSLGRKAVAWALESGYRLVDTASAYGNEREVGEAVRTSGLQREEVFVTTKLRPSETGPGTALRAFEASRRRLGLDHVDLYLIHWPGDDRDSRLGAWRDLEKLLGDGRCRAIGVSNYEVSHLREILEAGLTVPAVNQVEFSPFGQRREVHDFGRSHGIRLEGYSPLTRGERLDDDTVQAVARSHGRSAAQVLLRWAVQKEVITIPKSNHRERIVENAAVFDFELSAEDMAVLDGLEGGRRRRR